MENGKQRDVEEGEFVVLFCLLLYQTEGDMDGNSHGGGT
jgi:hypothetical protein